jgi:aminoglycoside phosphotransferase (APT) family kinase protein
VFARLSTTAPEQNVLDVSPARNIQQIDWHRMEAWLRHALPACRIPGLNVNQPMHVEQCQGGHSNLTYLIRFGEQEFIGRLPPFGLLPHAAHDMSREFRWLSALHPVFPLTPRPYLLCDDLAVAGSVFYVMERRHGIIIRGEEPPAIAGNPSLRRRVGTALVDTLASLHRIDLNEAGLSHLGKPAGFVERQVRGWSERWQRFKTFDVPELDALSTWLHQRVPPDPERPGVVHGDFKLDNVLLDADYPDRVVAVFDWEMSALGEPLIDLGMLLAYWVQSAPPEHQDALTTVTDRPGWLTREEVIDRYAARSGRSLGTLSYFEVFAFFKIAVVIQQIYYRYVSGQTDDPRFAVFGERVKYLARSATRLVERL